MKNNIKNIKNEKHFVKVKGQERSFSNYMQLAIDVAEKQLLKQNKEHKHIGDFAEIPIGCVIVNNETGKVVAKSCNKTISTNNSTNHAEIVCIDKAMKKMNTNRLTNCSMYITLEPCVMCAGAIMLAKIGRVYIGCLSKKTGAIVSNLHLYKRTICNHMPDVYYCIMEKECRELLRGFFRDV